MENFIKIGSRKIGPDYKPFVIAEIGINHGGKLSVAKKMVDLAFKTGAECIKHQTHVIEDEMSDDAKKFLPLNQKKSIYQIMKECALSESDEIKLKKYVESKNMIFLSTPFSREASNRLNKMKVKAFKIGSGECNNLPLIEHIAKFKKPMIISTGMNKIKDIKETVKVLKKNKVKFALLHCTNIYPTPAKFVRFGAMMQLKKTFPNTVYGLSDHTTSNLACLGAGEQDVNWIGHLLSLKDRSKSAATAKPNGLYLVDVTYPDEHGLPKPPLGPLFLPDRT